jgi:hypothetical protein
MSKFSAAAAALAAKTADAYSADRYQDWTAVALEFLSNGYSEREAEALMRSKYMRWAADESEQEYGAVQASIVVGYVRANISARGLAQLVEETFAV